MNEVIHILFSLTAKKQHYVSQKKAISQEIQTKNEFLNSLEPQLKTILKVGGAGLLINIDYTELYVFNQVFNDSENHCYYKNYNTSWKFGNFTSCNPPVFRDLAESCVQTFGIDMLSSCRNILAIVISKALLPLLAMKIY